MSVIHVTSYMSCWLFGNILALTQEVTGLNFFFYVTNEFSKNMSVASEKVWYMLKLEVKVLHDNGHVTCDFDQFLPLIFHSVTDTFRLSSNLICFLSTIHLKLQTENLF